MSNNVNLIYLDGKTQKIRYNKKAISSGADGTIYASVDKKLALKIYHDPLKDKQRQDKLWQMLSHAPKGNGFCWPVAILSDQKSNFIGYAMPLLDLSHCHTLEILLSKRLRSSLGISESYQFRVKVAVNLAQKVAELHQLGHHIIDLKPANLSFDQRNAEVVVLDCDGFSIQGNNKQFLGHQYTAGYIAPEAFAAQLAPEKLGEAQDLFALAAILFQLLNNGLHPFQGVSKDGKPLPTDNQAKITAGLYAYAKMPHKKIKPSPWSIHDDFPDALLQAFSQSLTSTHRIKASAWQQLLAKQSLNLKVCQQDTSHSYWQKNCPHCKLGQTRANIQQQAKTQKKATKRKHQTINRQNLSTGNVVASAPSKMAPSTLLFVIFTIIFIVVIFTSIDFNSAPTSVNVPKKEVKQREISAVSSEISTLSKAPTIAVANSLSGNITYREIKRGFQSKANKLAEIPFHQFTRFDSSSNFPLLNYFPFGVISPSSSAEISLKTINFEMMGKELGQLKKQNDRLYRLNDWQYDNNTETAYVYKCKYNPSICTGVSQVGMGEEVTYTFNSFSAERILMDNTTEKTEHSYRPWRFSLTSSGKKLIMASNFELVVYDVNNPKEPLLKQKLPTKWQDWHITRLLTIDGGQRLLLSLAKSEKYGVNYQGFVVELTLTDGSYQVTTDFSTLPNANSMSGVDIATNLSGDILAIGEYAEEEINNDKYTFFGDPVEVALAYPMISLWKKTTLGWQPISTPNGKTMRITPKQRKPTKVLVKVPASISNAKAQMSFMRNSKLFNGLGLNRGFKLNQAGDTLLTGIDAKEQRDTIFAKAFIYKLDASTNSLTLSAKLARSYRSSDSSNADSFDTKRIVHLSSTLSNDGKQAALGWFMFSDVRSADLKKTFAAQEYKLDLFNIN
ncbi:hypothetical protein GCM10009111_20920 [Colwellia asteriadis]|uniref:Protein kinase domain-containing protein n=1 Tax=Colwellia asteriadis TaxID=517723 RepID=A0ABN1L7M0_9GAMM